MRRDKGEKIMNFRKSEAEYFYCRDWTAQISLNAQAKSVSWRSAFRTDEDPPMRRSRGRKARSSRPTGKMLCYQPGCRRLGARSVLDAQPIAMNVPVGA
jgi:hypothetical protein